MNKLLVRLLCFLTLLIAGQARAETDHLIFVGNSAFGEAGIEEGIYSVRLDQKTGKLTMPILAAKAATSPAFLALSPNRERLYATVVLDEPVDGKKGGVSAYAIDAHSGGLRLLNTRSTVGDVVAHLVVDPTSKALLLANYSSGSVVSFALEEDGSLGGLKTLISLSGASGVNPRRQGTPCPHAVALSPDNRYLFVPALGQDKTAKFKLDAKVATIELEDPAAAVSAPGAGPRHATFSTDGKFYYSLNELNGTVDVQAYDAAGGVLTHLQTISTLPKDFTATNASAEIRAHPNGKFIYASNRGHDSIAVFSRDSGSGRLTLVETAPCGGQHPRNFDLSPDGSWLVCGNRDTNNLVSFAIDQASGRLRPSGYEVPLARPYCVQFAD